MLVISIPCKVCEQFLKFCSSNIAGFLYDPMGTLNSPFLLTLYRPLKQVLFKYIKALAILTGFSSLFSLDLTF